MSKFNEIFKRLFKPNETINAKSAYMKAKYGQDFSEEELLTQFFTSTKALIEAKSSNGHFCAMVEIDEDIQKFVPEIIELYENKLGYQTIKIDKSTDLNGETLGSIRSTFLIIIWNN